MKSKNLFACAAAALLLSACSPDDPAINPNTGGTFEGDGYLAISINLPSTQGTRAENDKFDDGDPDEYKVTDGVLVIFKGENENDAKCMSAYKLEDIQPTGVGTATDNVTTRFAKAVKVENVSLGEKEHLYALVMLNYTDVCSVFDNNLVIDGSTFNGTFKDFLAKKSSHKLYHSDSNDYFFMTNSPLAESAGYYGNAPANTNVSTLALLSGDLQKTETDALNHINGHIYVERAVAKATLSAPEEATLSDGQKLKIKSVEWVIENDEPQSFVVRNVVAPDVESFTGFGGKNLNYLAWASPEKTPTCYRFLGSNSVKIENPNAADAYRLYWAIDPAYDVERPYNGLGATPAFKSKSTVLYCHENTFDVAHQDYRYTTRAILKVTYDVKEFWTLNGDIKKAFTDFKDVETYAKNYILHDQNLQKAVYEALKAGSKDYDYSGDVKLGWTYNATDGSYKLSSIGFNTNTTDYDTTPSFEATNLIAATNNLYKIVMYKDGVSYYDFRFMHFAGHGDTDLAPWTAPANGITNTVNDSYGDRDNNKTINENSEIKYLGRYGMVRNNWYDVKITAFNTLGSPIIPEGKLSKPDDNVDTEQWLSFQINILAWAKRYQEITL